MVSRARTRIQGDRPRFAVAPDTHRRLLERFMHAMHSGDRESIMALLHADARLVSDGGGKATAVIRPLEGAQRIADLYWAVARRAAGQVESRLGHVNGEPALLRFHEGRLHSATRSAIDQEGRTPQVVRVHNPEKLRGLLR